MCPDHADSDDDFGQLPRSSPQHELERASSAALDHLLTSKYDRELELRSEPGPDTGVDRYLEVKVNGRYTKCQALVQLKGTDSAKPLSKGGLAHPVEVYNLNYLRQGLSSIYILYDRPRDEFWYAWARDERGRLDAERPGWRDKRKVRLHFKRRLDAGGITEIRARVLAEGRLARDVLERHARLQVGDKLTLALQQNKPVITDGSEALDRLLAEGFDMAAAGRADEVLELATKLSAESRSYAGVQLILANAEFMRSRAQHALGYLAEAALKADQLPTEAHELLAGLQLECEFLAGRISRDEYLRKQHAFAASCATPLRDFHRLEELRLEFLDQPTPDRQDEILEEVVAIDARVQGDSDAGPGRKAHARFMHLLLRGLRWSAELQEWSLVAMLLRAFGLMTPSDADERAKGAAREVDCFIADVSTFIEEVRQLSQPWILGEALLLRALAYVIQLRFVCMARVLTGGAFGREDQHLQTEKDALAAVDVFRRAGMLHAELRAQMVLADYYELTNHGDKARELALQAQPTVEAMSYGNLVASVRAYVAGRSMLRQDADRLAGFLTGGLFAMLASLTDDELHLMARRTASRFPVSEEQMGTFEVSFFAGREAGRERVRWCRYLNLEERRPPAGKPWEIALPLVWRCVRRQHIIEAPRSEWLRFLRGFERTHCEDCSDRNPLETDASNTQPSKCPD
ncbi:MAG: DUF4365 domain-containing protein [bacterium]